MAGCYVPCCRTPEIDVTEIRVVIAEDQRLLRESLATLLDAEPDLTVVATAASGDEAVAEVVRHRPDVVLMDIRMPVLDGISATRALCRRPELRACKVVILTMFDLDEYVVEGLRAGASGFLLKDTPPQALVDAVRTVHSGQALLSPTALTRIVGHVALGHRPAADSAVLTARQRDVLTQVARGLSNDEIEAQLHIAKGTVKTHIAALLQRLGARDRAQLVIAAYESGLIAPGR
jgi:DNA-binding NarL/FixJ family response regulator